MGLMHGPDKHSAQYKSAQVDKAVLVIYSGQQHDDQQKAKYQAGAGRQDKNVFLTEGLKIGPRNAAVDPATKSVCERLFHGVTEALGCRKSSWYSSMFLL
ncbi:hypothetical protein [Marinobacter salsuginis]|uniref:hypothetical protein n=1 Tax=Marinobacter salsuginis TaxID=418719 RepID=UPI001E5975CF|nr:hypothetical protein [Marinobacter salsuginis]